MTQIRKWLLIAGAVLALMLPLASIASADLGDGGFGLSGGITTAAPKHK